MIFCDENYMKRVDYFREENLFNHYNRLVSLFLLKKYSLLYAI